MARLLTLTANTLLDALAGGPVRVGRVNRVARFELVAGGKGLNAGRVLARLGHRVVAAGFAGGWSGRLLAEAVADSGMEPLLVETKARTRIGFNVSGASEGIAFLEDGFTVEPAEVDRLVAAIAGRLSTVDLVLVSGSVPDSSCVDLYARVLAACAGAAVPCWLDAYGPAVDRAMSAGPPPALIKVNREELGDGGRFARCPEVHVTDGPRPIEIRAAAVRWVVRPPALVERSAIGSGDCYFAALADARLAGRPLVEQLRFAAAAGAANAALGATARIGRAEIEPWLDRVVVEAAR